MFLTNWNHFSNWPIWPIEGALKGTTISGQSRPGTDGNKRNNFIIYWASELECHHLSYPGCPFFVGGESSLFAENAFNVFSASQTRRFYTGFIITFFFFFCLSSVTSFLNKTSIRGFALTRMSIVTDFPLIQNDIAWFHHSSFILFKDCDRQNLIYFVSLESNYNRAEIVLLFFFLFGTNVKKKKKVSRIFWWTFLTVKKA